MRDYSGLSPLAKSIEIIRLRVTQLLYSGKNPNPDEVEVRPVTPADLGLDCWLWDGKPVAIRPKAHIAFTGIHSRFLLQARLRYPSDNVFALAVTSQSEYEARWWKKDEIMYLDWKVIENALLRVIPCAITGYVLEPRMATVL